MKDFEKPLIRTQVEQKVKFDNKNLTPIEELVIGSTPEGSSYETVVEDAKTNPETLLTPTSLSSSEKNRLQIEVERQEKAELIANGFFDPDVSIDLYRSGMVPTMVLSPLDEEGRVNELRIGRRDIYTKEYRPFVEEDVEKYSLGVREELKPILKLTRINEDGLLIFKQNILKEDEEDVA